MNMVINKPNAYEANRYNVLFNIQGGRKFFRQKEETA